MGRRILLGESNPFLAGRLWEKLQGGFDIDSADCACAIRSKLVERNYSVAVIGLEMPLPERLALIRDSKRLSPQTRLFVYFTALRVHERIQTLEAGADGYMMQPFHLDEFLVRVRILTRDQDEETDAFISAGDLDFDQGSGQILHCGEPLELPFAEHRVLTMLMAQFGHLVDKALIERTLGNEAEALTTNNVEKRISRLRRVLDDLNSNLRINTVRGMGYVLERGRHACFALSAFAADPITTSIVEFVAA